MRFIEPQEVDFINTVALSLRMSNRRKTIEYFRSQYHLAPDNPEIAFNYGICMSLFTSIAAEPREKLPAQLTAQKALSMCLQQRKNWWLARFIRSEVLQAIPEGFFQMSQNIHSENYKTMMPDHDIRVLIEQQKASGVEFSYFLCPYISQAVSHLSRDDVEEAIIWYKKGLEDVTLSKSPFQLVLLAQPFTTAAHLFRHFKVFDCAEEMKQITAVMFPNIKAPIHSFDS